MRRLGTVGRVGLTEDVLSIDEAALAAVLDNAGGS